MNKCDCGATITGHLIHSDWCSTLDKANEDMTFEEMITTLEEIPGTMISRRAWDKYVRTLPILNRNKAGAILFSQQGLIGEVWQSIDVIPIYFKEATDYYIIKD